MKTILYQSVTTEELSPDVLSDILETARAHNEKAGVTGVLLYADGRFMQVLEGPSRAVRSIMRSIVKDSRHEDVEILLDGKITERRFPEWSMGIATGEPVSDLYRESVSRVLEVASDWYKKSEK